MGADGATAGMTDTQQRRAAALARRWLGTAAIDRLLGAEGAAGDAVDRLLANDPVVTAQTVQDGRDLLADEVRDHPDGLWAERFGRLLTHLRNIAVGVFLVAATGVVVLAIVVSPSGDPDLMFGELAQWLGIAEGGVAAIMLVPLATCLLLLAVGGAWGNMVLLAQARYAVRWAGSRPGQAGRGIPIREPITAFGGLLRLPAVLLWSAAAVLLVLILVLRSDGDSVGDLTLWMLAAALAGWLLRRASRMFGRAGSVATEHLFVLEEDEGRGLPVDAATAVRERILLVTRGELGVITTEERTVYPGTADLPEADLRRRHAAVSQSLDTDLSVLGRAGEGPLVTREQTGEHGGVGGRFEAEYAGGWLVAQGRVEWPGRDGWIVVQDEPARFAREVLPLFGDRLGVSVRGSVLGEPEQVPGSVPWVEDWVKARA